jgi:16S rRNA (guanine527-N7)-methyltransferase
MEFEKLDIKKQGLLENYLDLLLDKNKELNLTAIKNKEDGMLLHIEDALSALPYFNYSPEGLYGDLGTGGGVPGIPLAIASGRKTVLVDSSKKKMRAVHEIITRLGLQEQITVCDLRIEELAIRDRESFSVITARALAGTSSLLELTSPLLCLQGIFIALKGNIDNTEIISAEKTSKVVGMNLVSMDRVVSFENINRHILCYKKSQKAKIKLPRRNGLAQKSPLF